MRARPSGAVLALALLAAAIASAQAPATENTLRLAAGESVRRQTAAAGPQEAAEIPGDGRIE